MKTQTQEIETEITISYEELQRTMAISIVERLITRGINGYENRLYDEWSTAGHILYHLFPKRFSEGEFMSVIKEVEKEGVVASISRESVDGIPTSIYRHSSNPHNRVARQIK